MEVVDSHNLYMSPSLQLSMLATLLEDGEVIDEDPSQFLFK
jgi:hypothetical protein